MDQQNTGSFAAILGGADPLKAAIARRATGGGALNQVTPSAATFNPQTVPPSAPTGAVPMPQQGAPQGTPLPAQLTPQTAGIPTGTTPVEPPQTDSTLIINALGEALKNLTKQPKI